MEEIRSEESQELYFKWMEQQQLQQQKQKQEQQVDSNNHPLPVSRDHDDENERRLKKNKKKSGSGMMGDMMKMSSASTSTSTMSMTMMSHPSSSEASMSTKEPSSSKGRGSGMMGGQHTSKGMMMMPSSKSKGKGKGKMTKGSKTDSSTAFPSEQLGLDTLPPSVSSMPSDVPSTFPSFSVFPTGEPSFNANCLIPEDLGGNCTEQIVSGLDYECVSDCVANSRLLFADETLVDDTSTLQTFCEAGCPCSDNCYCTTRDCLTEYDACFETAFNGDQSCDCLGASATTDPFANLVLCDSTLEEDWGVEACIEECATKFDEINAEMDGCINFCECLIVEDDCFNEDNSSTERQCCVYDCEAEVRFDYDNPLSFCQNL